MEGIEQNPMVYALMLENVWRDQPVDKDEFLRSYLTQRYGSFNETAFKAWQIIMASAYENTVNNGGQESILTGRPSFKENPGGTTNTKAHYDKEELKKAWQMLVSCHEDFVHSDGYRYDLVDVTRQVLADYASVLQQKVAKAYEAGDIEAFRKAADDFLGLIDDMDSLLGTRNEFLLGRWLKDARAIGHTQQEKDLYERNARNLITLWGNKDCRIRDYACRQWNGMMSGFYHPRWERFFTFVEAAMQKGCSYDEERFISESKDWEWEWLSGHEEYPSQPAGDEIQECLKIWNKYSKDILHLEDNFEYEADVEAYV
jgi:alpha-N-acetylglucosaminidase